MSGFEGLLCRAGKIGQKKIVAGYDGFVDTIVRPVKKTSAGSAPEELFDTIEEFGRFLAGKANKSCSIELKTEARLGGGNMPSLAAGAGKLGFDVTCIGMLGEPGRIEDVFSNLPCRAYSFAPPGVSTCLEFRDGKVFLAPGISVPGDIWDRVDQATHGRASAWIGEADLLALVNWSELSFSQKLWEQTYENAFRDAECDRQKFVLFDLCDISRRRQEEVQSVVRLMGLYSQKRRTLLSMNENEALVMGRCIDKMARTGQSGHIGQTAQTGHITQTAQTVRQTGEMLVECYGIDEVLIHTLRESILISKRGTFTEKALFVEQPIRSTGAGDHFNAAACFGAVMGLEDAARLAFANQYVNLYLTTGNTPTLEDTIVHGHF